MTSRHQKSKIRPTLLDNRKRSFLVLAGWPSPAVGFDQSFEQITVAE